MHTDNILPTRQLESLLFAVGTTDSESVICDRLALANRTPWAISADSATIRLRKAASTIGGSAPTLSNDCNFSTKACVGQRRFADHNPEEPGGQLAGTVCQPVLHWLTYG